MLYQVPVGDAIAEFKQVPVKKGGSILDGVIHRVKIIFVKYHRDGFVKHFIKHAITQEALRVICFLKWFPPGKKQIPGEFVRVEVDVLSKPAIVEKERRGRQVRVANEWFHLLGPSAFGYAKEMRIVTNFV